MAERWLAADDVAAHVRDATDTADTWIPEVGMPERTIGRHQEVQARVVDEGVRSSGPSTSAIDLDNE